MHRYLKQTQPTAEQAAELFAYCKMAPPLAELRDVPYANLEALFNDLWRAYQQALQDWLDDEEYTQGIPTPKLDDVCEMFINSLA